MRTTLLALLLFSIPALAQGAGGSSQGAVGQALKSALKQNTTAGPGAIQQSFFDSLQKSLNDKFGKKTASKLMNNMQGKSLSKNDVQKFMNGLATKSQVKDWFGASRKQMGKLEQSVDDAVAEKNRNGFFGIMIIVMVVDFGMDPSADFCSQACGAKEELDEEAFKKLCSGNVSTNNIKDAFGFGSKDDCKFMQEILNAMQSSPFAQHPMMQSMGMGKGGKFDPSKFPSLGEGMPGFGMEGFEAGGMACDFELPPCPFLDGSFEDMMKKCEKEAEEAEGPEKPKPDRKKKRREEEREDEED
ncbi:MAG: hypothetical protein ACYTHK_07255 [Planctomycetota bacterium]|jgi:hypothetical protein